MKLNDAIDKMSQELNIPKETVKTAYYYFWEFLKTNIESLPLKEEMTEEEFNTLKTSFNVPSLGKFYTTYELVRYLQDNYKNGRVKNKED